MTIPKLTSRIYARRKPPVPLVILAASELAAVHASSPVDPVAEHAIIPAPNVGGSGGSAPIFPTPRNRGRSRRVRSRPIKTGVRAYRAPVIAGGSGGSATIFPDVYSGLTQTHMPGFLRNREVRSNTNDAVPWLPKRRKTRTSWGFPRHSHIS
jgi:hypothetical protein